MAEPVVYDKAKYHYDGDFPAELAAEQGFIHTGMFLGWIIDHGLYSDWFGPEMNGYITAFKNRELTGAKVFEACDGALVDDMLSDEGNAFAQDYFNFARGKYLADYAELLGKGLPTIYHVADTWANYDKLSQRIDKRYREWQRGNSGGWRSFFKKRR
jgi:hypothetical protein